MNCLMVLWKGLLLLGAKVYGFTQFKHDGSINETKKAKGTNKCVIDKTWNFDHLKKCLFNNETIRCIQHRFKSKPGLINTIEINKVALKNKDNKRLRTFDGITKFDGKMNNDTCRTLKPQNNKYTQLKTLLKQFTYKELTDIILDKIIH